MGGGSPAAAARREEKAAAGGPALKEAAQGWRQLAAAWPHQGRAPEQMRLQARPLPAAACHRAGCAKGGA